MHVALWVATGVLAAIFAWSGSAKVSMSRERLLATGQTGIAVYPMWLVRVAATCELLAVVGLIAPWLSGIARFLTPMAGAGLAIVMVGAAYAHTRLREPKAVGVNLLLFALAVFVLFGRAAALS